MFCLSLRHCDEDNATCLADPTNTGTGPGFGGAYDGTKIPCEREGPPEDYEMYCRQDAEREGRVYTAREEARLGNKRRRRGAQRRSLA